MLLGLRDLRGSWWDGRHKVWQVLMGLFTLALIIVKCMYIHNCWISFAEGLCEVSAHLFSFGIIRFWREPCNCSLFNFPSIKLRPDKNNSITTFISRQQLHLVVSLRKMFLLLFGTHVNFSPEFTHLHFLSFFLSFFLSSILFFGGAFHYPHTGACKSFGDW